MSRHALAALLLALPACGGGAGTPDAGAPGGADAAASPDAADELTPIPADTLACESPEYWPLALGSQSHPLTVHYRAPSEAGMAAEVIGYLDHSWDVEVDQLGFRPPLPDGGDCGTDGAFDVFLWRGNEESYVDVLAENPDTAWDDYSAYMVVDPWGPYGGDILDTTMAHEFNHACQAADDWNEPALLYEMTSMFIEDEVYDDDNEYRGLLADFQNRPDWSLDRNDDYETWYMYGAALYLWYLRDRFFDGDASFVADMWLRLRSEPDTQEPDFVDALDEILSDQGSSYLGSVVEFERWRWYTGARDDGHHFEEGAEIPADATVPATAVQAAAASLALDPAPMLLGSAYLEVSRMPGDPAAVTVAIDADDPDVRWVVQVVPGDNPGSDGELLDLSTGPATVTLPEGGSRTLIVTALPAGDYDPDERTDDRYPAAVVLAPAD